MKTSRWFPTLTGVKVDEDRTLPYKLLDAIFQIYRKFYDLSDRIDSLAPAVISQDATVTIQATRGEMNLYPASSYALGSRYIITDWNNAVYVCQMVDEAHAWRYQSGRLLCDQSELSGLAAEMGANDSGLLAWVNVYHHQLYWNGSGFSFDPTDSGSKQVQMFAGAPTSPGWKLLDGTGDDGAAIGVGHPIDYLKADGTVGHITALDDLTAGTYPKFGAAFTGALVAATAPGFTGGVDPASAGTPAGSVTVNPAVGGVTAGTGASVAASQNHGHTASFAGSALADHSHTLTGAAVDDAGEPAHMMLLPYFRK